MPAGWCRTNNGCIIGGKNGEPGRLPCRSKGWVGMPWAGLGPRDPAIKAP